MEAGIEYSIVVWMLIMWELGGAGWSSEIMQTMELEHPVSVLPATVAPTHHTGHLSGPSVFFFLWEWVSAASLAA